MKFLDFFFCNALALWPRRFMFSFVAGSVDLFDAADRRDHVVKLHAKLLERIGEVLIFFRWQAEVVSDLDKFRTLADGFGLAVVELLDSFGVGLGADSELLGVDFVLLDLKQW